MAVVKIPENQLDLTNTNAAIDAKMPKAGGTFTGDVTISSGKFIAFPHYKIGENGAENAIIGDGNGNGLVVLPNGRGAAMFYNNGTQYTEIVSYLNVKNTYSPSGTDPVTGTAVKSAIDAAISALYKPAGSVAFEDLPTLSSSILGNVYNVTDSFTTTSDFVEGAGNTYPAGTNVVVVEPTSGTYKFDVMAGFVDLTPYRTSAAQDIIDAGKQDTITGAATSITSSNLTANKALVSDSNGKVAASSVTDTELGYLSGVTSAVQTQMDAKQPKTLSSAITVGGVSQTTVEATLGALNTVKAELDSNNRLKDEQNPYASATAKGAVKIMIDEGMGYLDIYTEAY